MFSLALYEPDIAPNCGAVMRLAACFGMSLHVIEPCGFVFSSAALRRAAMDYANSTALYRHKDWQSFRIATSQQRLVLFTTKGAKSLGGFPFTQGDVLLFGSESAGVPEAVHEAADVRVRVPLRPEARSLNLGMSAAIAAAEAMRQLHPGWQAGTLET